MLKENEGITIRREGGARWYRKPQKQCAGTRTELVKRKSDIEIYLPARIINWTLGCWYNRAALNSHRQDYTGKVTKAGAAAEGGRPQELQRKRQNSCPNGCIHVSNSVTYLLWSPFRATFKSFEYDWQLLWLFAFPSWGWWNFNQNYLNTVSLQKLNS